MRSVAKSGKSENGQIAVNSEEVNSISMRLPTYSYSKVSSGWRFISSTGVERISSCVSGVTSRSGGNLLPEVALSELTAFGLVFFEANLCSLQSLFCPVQKLQVVWQKRLNQRFFKHTFEMPQNPLLCPIRH